MQSFNEEGCVTPAEPEDFEAGDEPVEVERRPRAGAVLSIRLTSEEFEQLQELAKARRMTLSRLGRTAILSYLEGGEQWSNLPVQWTVAMPFPGVLPAAATFNVELIVTSPGRQSVTAGEVRELEATVVPGSG
jgi:predicted DNA-binding ribbon-helix-helix protein